VLIVLMVGCTGSDSAGGNDGGGTRSRIGGVSASQTAGGKAGATAFFIESEGSITAGCTEEVEGSCSVSVCPRSVPDAGATSVAHLALFQAGMITISSGSTSLVINPGADSRYEGKTSDTPLWTPGAPISFVATGATVPAFAETLDAPSDVVFTSPQPSISLVSVPRGGDLAIAWTGGGKGEVAVSLTVETSATTHSITCAFASAAGGAKIAAAVLAKLPAGSGILLAYTRGFKQVTAGGWRLNLSATDVSGVLTLPFGLE
jgi:hypothetical protein